MKFTIEFQPAGLRLILDEPTTLLDAIRQAGISLRSDCGGKGICGKCVVQLLSCIGNNPPGIIENSQLDAKQISEGYRLACETIVNKDLKVFVPQDSVIEGQVLQVEGRYRVISANPVISQKTVELEEANLNDLLSDFTRINASVDHQNITADLNVIRKIPELLRNNQWQINLIIKAREIINVTPQPLEKLVGLAVDVGSTKLACYLVDLQSGMTIAARGTSNPQIAFGEDIMARLAYAMESPAKAEHLHRMLFEAINQTTRDLCEQSEVPQSEITDAVLVGNTAMHHFFLNLPVSALAVSPFVPAFSDPVCAPAKDLGLAAMPGCAVYAPAVIAGFIGSDHLAFLLAEGFGNDNRVRLGIDIGTNTEIALQKGGRIVSVSTASGPAFEGAHIQFGMRAAPGAIEHVTFGADGKAQIQVIGEKAPTGICGSGILDAVAEMRRVGLLNSRGRMDKQFPGVGLDDMGKPFFKLSEGEKTITMSQNDVDQILLAKGAIRAGIDVLMNYLKVSPPEIENVVIAGAFGTYMLPEQAMRIGMLPEIALDRVQSVGNAAGAGARMMLASSASRKKAEALARRVEYLELTIYPDFPMFYARGIQA